MDRSGMAIVVGVAAALLAAPAWAQDVAAARALFEKGLADMEAGRYETGCSLLGESHRLDPRPGTLFTLAECEAKRGRLATAVARYGEYLALYERLPPAQRAKQLDRDRIAARQKATLGPRVPELTLRLPPTAPPGTVVKRDALVLEAPALGVGLPVDPGDHVVITQPPGEPETTLRFTLAPGERRVIELSLKAPEEPAPSGGTRRTVAFVAGGIGVAWLGVGAVTGGLMISKKGAIEAGCHDGAGGVKLCTPAGAAAGESAKTFGAVATVGFALGLAAVGAGVVLLVTAPRVDAPAAAAARWLGAGVIAAGPDGAVLGAQGVW
jgi:hypothetical protein